MLGFARFTAQHTIFSMALTPCAEHLFQWLLQRFPAGKTQEIDLEEYQEFTGLGRKQPYCFRSVKEALKSLIEAGYVVVVRKYNKRFWKVQALHPVENPGPVKDPSPTEKTPSPGEIKVSKKQLSNPDSLVAYNREILEETDKTVNSVSPELAEIAQMGIKINPSIEQTIAAAEPGVVARAVAVVKERIAKGNVKNPGGLLVKAIQGRWGTAKAKVADFNNWFRTEQAQGNVIGSQVINGKIFVYDKNMQAKPYEDLSDVLADIDTLVALRGWGKAELSAYLTEHFGVGTRSLLSESALLKLRDGLKNG